MTIVIEDQQIISLQKILEKNTNNTTMKEIISLIFNAIRIIANDRSHIDQNKWKKIYDKYQSELERQNSLKWPLIKIIKNNSQLRIDVLSITYLYISSNNFLTLLLRLLVIENYKRPYIYDTYKYHKIFSHKITNNAEITIKNISLFDLFTLLKAYLNYYISIYTNEHSLEYHLASSILKKFE